MHGGCIVFFYQIVSLREKSTNHDVGKKLIISCCALLTPYIMTLARMLKETTRNAKQRFTTRTQNERL